MAVKLKNLKKSKNKLSAKKLNKRKSSKINMSSLLRIKYKDEKEKKKLMPNRIKNSNKLGRISWLPSKKNNKTNKNIGRMYTIKMLKI